MLARIEYVAGIFEALWLMSTLRKSFFLNNHLNSRLNSRLNGHSRSSGFWNAAPERVAENKIMESNVV